MGVSSLKPGSYNPIHLSNSKEFKECVNLCANVEIVKFQSASSNFAALMRKLKINHLVETLEYLKTDIRDKQK